MNLIVISTGSRPALLRQTFESMRQNAADWSKHATTLVLDGCLENVVETWKACAPNSTIVNSQRRGASASRNIGAGSIPRESRHQQVMFVDEDCFFTKDWDEQYDDTFMKLNPYHFGCVSGYAHPFNHPTDTHYPTFDETDVISTVAMAMTWRLWDVTGQHFELPGGAGGSEDYEFCQRAKAAGAKMAITKPMCVLHTGLTSSTGKPIVGARELEALNHSLVLQHGLAGRVLFQ